MGIRFVVVGRAADGHELERWFLRNRATIDVARMDMLLDNAIREIIVISLCLVCGEQRIKSVCTNPECSSRQPALPAPEAV